MPSEPVGRASSFDMLFCTIRRLLVIIGAPFCAIRHLLIIVDDPFYTFAAAPVPERQEGIFRLTALPVATQVDVVFLLVFALFLCCLAY